VIPPPGLQIYLLPSVTLTLGRLSPGLQICLLFSVTLSFGLLCASCYDTVSIYSNMYVPELLKMRQTVQCTLVLVSFQSITWRDFVVVVATHLDVAVHDTS